MTFLAHRKDMCKFDSTNIDAAGLVVVQKDQPEVDKGMNAQPLSACGWIDLLMA